MAKKDSINNKIRLVYQVDKDGNPISFISLEHSESMNLLSIFRYIKQKRIKDRWIYLREISESLNIPISTLQKLISRLAGVQRVEIFKNDEPQVLFEYPFLVQKGLFNHKTNLPRTPKFLKAPFQIKVSPHIKV